MNDFYLTEPEYSLDPDYDPPNFGDNTSTEAQTMPETRNQRIQTYRSILTTAIEGGISYWATVLKYSPDMHDDTLDLGPACSATILDSEDPGTRYDLNTATIRSAMAKLHKGGGYRPDGTSPDWWAKKWRAAYRDCATGEWDFDASDADVVVQVAVFGEVVYG